MCLSTFSWVVRSRELSGVEFRKHSATTARDRARAEALVTEVLEDYLAIEEILELEPQADPFEGVRCEQVESYEEVEDKAIALRKKWQLGLDPISSMSGLLEDKGIKVIQADLPQRFDGLACAVKLSGDRPDTEVIVISERTSIERRRFNLAHELGHRVIRSSANPDLPLEKAMHRFGAAFLVPKAHLEQEVGLSRQGIPYPELIRLKRFYGISAAAMLLRLRDIGILSSAAVEYAFRGYAKPWRTDEPEPIMDYEGFGEFEKPARFERLVWRAIGEKLISPVRAAQLLKLSLDSVEKKIRGTA